MCACCRALVAIGMILLAGVAACAEILEPLPAVYEFEGVDPVSGPSIVIQDSAIVATNKFNITCFPYKLSGFSTWDGESITIKIGGSVIGTCQPVNVETYYRATVYRLQAGTYTVHLVHDREEVSQDSTVLTRSVTVP